MFNQHLFPSFHSLRDFFEEGMNKPQGLIKDDDRTTRLTIWRESLLPNEARVLLPPQMSGVKLKKRYPEMRKLSYLPGKLSRLEGIERFFDVTDATIITPTPLRPNSKEHGQFFYLIPRNVTVMYGPYHYLGILEYRTERLHGLLAALKFAGANSILRASRHINHVSVWYIEKEIFTCKITDLHHGGDGELDHVAFEAAQAFTLASKKVLVNVRHKYKFDKNKGNLFREECEKEYQPPETPFQEEFLGEYEYIDPSYTYTEREYAGEAEEEELIHDGTGSKIQRISLPSHQRVPFKPRNNSSSLYSYNDSTYSSRNSKDIGSVSDDDDDEGPGEDEEEAGEEGSQKPWERKSLLEHKIKVTVASRHSFQLHGAYSRYKVQ